MHDTIRFRRVTAAVAVLVLLVPGVVAADQAVSHRGAVGAHSLTDSAEYAGARCLYDDEQNVDRVRVRPPTVFARDRTSARDRQWVGWVVELQYRPDDGAWSTVQKSAAAKVLAWEDSPAPFRQRTVTVAHPRGSGAWRVVSRMLWYRPGTSSTWQGTARHRITSYDYPLAPPGSLSWCPAGIL